MSILAFALSNCFKLCNFFKSFNYLNHDLIKGIRDIQPLSKAFEDSVARYPFLFIEKNFLKKLINIFQNFP